MVPITIEMPAQIEYVDNPGCPANGGRYVNLVMMEHPTGQNDMAMAVICPDRPTVLVISKNATDEDKAWFLEQVKNMAGKVTFYSRALDAR